ncbi:hypothetical protein H5410_045810 [Solanum commersonii]|uniref:Uncharacterized protein n=1 Tax=Solanum commersonii TaxID=4109 RepID=A0A9J5XER5_SOLCO|nr:hypothetical protein H5410_045810 [Solanum commersonii]
MIDDAAGVEFSHQVEPNVEESPNMGASRFFKMLNSAQNPLWHRCEYSELSETSSPDNKIPLDYYRAKKLVSGLGLTSQKINCCVNGCMLYYKADKEMTECKFCKEPHYKKRVGKKGKKKIPHKTMHYLPLIPRLQRL